MGVLVANLLQIAFLAVWLLVLGRVFLSWFDPAGRSPVGSFVISATEPILAPIRRVLPPTGALDLSPLVVLVVLSILWQVV
ncbi:MAG TPA: YggT family protein [Candidatus Limnocylindrales bacterium]|nr:YggT family protein [Candidatus Limnocylindrales bacterium]